MNSHLEPQPAPQPVVVDPKTTFLPVATIIVLLAATVGATLQVAGIQTQIERVSEVQVEMQGEQIATAASITGELKELRGSLSVMVTQHSQTENRIGRAEDRIASLAASIESILRDHKEFVTRRDDAIWRRRLKELNETLRMPEDPR